MMKQLLTLVALLAMATSATAVPKHWYSDWRWWVGEGMMAAAVVGDSVTTAHSCKGNCVETNPILGSHPSNGQIPALSSVNMAIQTGLHVWTWKAAHSCTNWPGTCEDTNKAWRAVSYWLQPAAVGVIGGYNINNNIQVNRAGNSLQAKKDYLYEMRHKQ